MKVILLKDSGETRVVRLSRPRRMALTLLLSFTILLPSLAAFHFSQAGPVDEGLVGHWQRQLAAQQAELRAVQALAVAESEATGRQLAAMQARLLRMEALGARVIHVAALEDGEFTFDNPPATGGPESSNRVLGGLELQRALADLSFDLKRREAELEVLEGLLRDRELRQATEIAGKPVARGWVSSSFGRRVDPFSGGSAFHAGIDFTARRGTEVLAAAGGVVIFSAVRHDFGKMIEINHGDGYVTRYAHQHELKVNVGEVVKRGQVIGTVGSTGRASGPHLHFEVLKHGRNVDPRRYIARGI